MAGRIHNYLANDHRRLEEALQRATATPGVIESQAYSEFRGGLLRHIGMEEKILLPAAQAARGGTPLPLAPKLRLDHGALALGSADLDPVAEPPEVRRDPLDI